MRRAAGSRSTWCGRMPLRRPVFSGSRRQARLAWSGRTRSSTACCSATRRASAWWPSPGRCRRSWTKVTNPTAADRVASHQPRSAIARTQPMGCDPHAAASPISMVYIVPCQQYEDQVAEQPGGTVHRFSYHQAGLAGAVGRRAPSADAVGMKPVPFAGDDALRNSRPTPRPRRSAPLRKRMEAGGSTMRAIQSAPRPA